MSDSCIFCKIASGEIPAQRVLETEHSVVFKDLNPRAPVHVLVIPKKHFSTVNDVTPADSEVMGDLFVAAAKAAQTLGVAGSGYRLVLNTNKDAGQEVFHIHAHLFAGQPMGWPPF